MTVPRAVAGGVHVKLNELEEPDPSTEPPLILLVEPAVKVPACVLKLLDNTELS